jgi:hypothetical protein
VTGFYENIQFPNGEEGEGTFIVNRVSKYLV